MRRIAAVFASKRSDRSDAASSTAASSAPDHSLPAQKPLPPKPHTRFFRSLSRKSKPVDPVVNRLNSSELHPPSSSSSSSGAPTTPDDDRGSLLRAPVSKSWHSLPHPVDPHPPSAFLYPDANPRDRTPFHSAPQPRAAPSRQSTLDTEDDTSEESSVALDLSRPPERSTPLSPSAYLLSLTSSNLRPPFAPPPLLHVPDRPLYPRSCNTRRMLPFQDTMESTMHRTRLQRRLQRGDLTPSERRSIASFGGRRTVLRERLSLQLDDNAVDYTHLRPFSAGLNKWADRPCFEDRVQVLLAENVPVGKGDEPAWTRVAPATGFGVAALEYSVALEVLAGLYEEEALTQQEPRGSDPDPPPLDFPRLDAQLSLDLSLSLSPSSASFSSPPSVPQSPAMQLSASAPATAPPVVAPSTTPSSNAASGSRNHHQYKANPSPLRMETTSTSPTASSIVASPASSATAVASPRPASTLASPPSSAPPVPLKSALKQGVRFVEGEKEDKEEGVPIGYVQRIKQKREEKARFLQAERERRRHEDERRKHEEERRKWEEERAAWEREKRAIEEERKKRMYAEEIAAARSRRESQRYGPLGTTGEGLATGQWDRTERPKPEREASSKYARPAYDPAAHPAQGPVRQGSDTSIHSMRSPRTGGGSGSGSPSDSRPNSVYGSANVSGSSRPPSTYSGVPVASSSQQDVRLRERRTSGTGSRRGSMVSESGGSTRRADPMTMPPLPQMWGMGVGMGMNMNVAPMQGMPMGMAVPMPMYAGMDMPLLPPSPPFMMQQYGPRSPSQNSNRNSQYSPQRSHSSSPTLGRQSLPASSSSERVNRLSQSHATSSSARAPSVPRSESTPQHQHQHRGHNRTSSGDQRPSAGPRTQSDDRRSTRSAAATSQRPGPTHSSSLPLHPPPAFNNQARQSWALPKSGFENVSRPSQGARRQTMIS